MTDNVFLEVPLDMRITLLRRVPCFQDLTQYQVKKLAALFQEVFVHQHERIVTEHMLVDRIFIIVRGHAEVSHTEKKRMQEQEIPVALLTAGETIGLNDTGFYSTSGKRTANVTSNTDMLLLSLDIQALLQFLKTEQIEHLMYDNALQLERMRFIKMALPFAKMSHERLKQLAKKVKEITLPANDVIFKQGDAGDDCYLIRSGRIEINAVDKNNHERILNILEAPALFGEASMLMHKPRNATAKTLEATSLFVLKHQHLRELMTSEKTVASTFMDLMIDRSLPKQSKHVSMHERKNSEDESFTILKNHQQGAYFNLSKEGTYIWQQLDGKHTLQDITLNLANTHHVFAPEMVVTLISKLNKAGFIENITAYHQTQTSSLLSRVFYRIQRLLNRRFAFGDIDKYLNNYYQQIIHYFFTVPAQIIFILFAIFGFINFIFTTPNVLLFFSFKHASLLLLLVLIPLSLVAVFLHELGHAFAAKAFGYEVHYMGIGWSGLSPIAFTDTSDMWLASRKPRMWVNFAGVYVDIIIAGMVSCMTFFLDNHPYWQCLLWLFAVYSYLHAFRMLSPLQNFDGYYILMDYLERHHLREDAVVWLLNYFPKAIKQPSQFRTHLPEIYYWIACLLFLMLTTIITLLMQDFILAIFGIQIIHVYISLILPFLIVIISSLGIIWQIRHQTKHH